MEIDKSKILMKVIADYEKENVYFSSKMFDDVRILHVVFEAMEQVEKLFIPDVIVTVCPKCKGDQIADTETGYKCCYTDCSHEWAK